MKKLTLKELVDKNNDLLSRCTINK